MAYSANSKATNELRRLHPIEFEILYREETAKATITPHAEDQRRYFRDKAKVRGRAFVRLRELFPKEFRELKLQAHREGYEKG